MLFVADGALPPPPPPHPPPHPTRVAGAAVPERYRRVLGDGQHAHLRVVRQPARGQHDALPQPAAPALGLPRPTAAPAPRRPLLQQSRQGRHALRPALLSLPQTGAWLDSASGSLRLQVLVYHILFLITAWLIYASGAPRLQALVYRILSLITAWLESASGSLRLQALVYHIFSLTIAWLTSASGALRLQALFTTSFF